MCQKLCDTPSNTTRRPQQTSEGEDLAWAMAQPDLKGEGGKDHMMTMLTLEEDIPGLLPNSKGMDGEDIS